MPKVKIDHDMRLGDFLNDHSLKTFGREDAWLHTEAFFHWDGSSLYLVPKEDVPDSVLEDLRLDAVL